MPNRFVPLRGGPPLPHPLNARLMHIEQALVNMGETPVSPAVVQQSQKVLGKSTGGGVSGSGGGGGGSSAILGGDVTGAPVNNTVSNLQAKPLTLTGVSQGDLISYSGTGFTNLQALVGNYTLTGNTTSPTLTVQSGSLTDANPAFLVDDANPNVLFWVHPRADLDAGFHPATAGITAYQTSKPGLLLTMSDSATATFPVTLSIGHATSGSPAAGLGVEVDLTAQGPGGGQIVCGSLVALYAGGGTGSENSTFIWSCRKGGQSAEVIRFRGTVGSAVSGGVGGQFWCRTEALFSGTTLGFFNATPTTQPTVTGSRGGNAALASLLTGLAALGLVVDSSTP